MIVTMKKFQIALIFGKMMNQMIKVEMKIVLLYQIMENGMMLLVMFPLTAKREVNLPCVKNQVIINRLIS